MELIVNVTKLNKRKYIPSALPDAAGIAGVVFKGFTFDGTPVSNTANPNLGIWYKDRDGYYYWGGGIVAGNAFGQTPSHAVTANTAPPAQDVYGFAPRAIRSDIPLPPGLPAQAILGTDVSHHNANPDWQALVDAGVQFVFIKTTEGAGTPDRMTHTHATNAQAHGLKIGYYHFCRPDTKNTGTVEGDAQAEAKAMLDVMSTLPKSTMPCVLDLEDQSAWDTPLQPHEYEKWITTFISALRNAGKEAMIYSRSEYLNRKLGSNHSLGQVKLWVSRYKRMKPEEVELPRGWNTFEMWQFTEKGVINEKTTVDLSIYIPR